MREVFFPPPPPPAPDGADLQHIWPGLSSTPSLFSILTKPLSPMLNPNCIRPALPLSPPSDVTRFYVQTDQSIDLKSYFLHLFQLLYSSKFEFYFFHILAFDAGSPSTNTDLRLFSFQLPPPSCAPRHAHQRTLKNL